MKPEIETILRKCAPNEGACECLRVLVQFTSGAWQAAVFTALHCGIITYWCECRRIDMVTHVMAHCVSIVRRPTSCSSHHRSSYLWTKVGSLLLWYAGWCVKPSFFNGCLYLALVGSRQGNRAVNPRKTPSRLMRCNWGVQPIFSLTIQWRHEGLSSGSSAGSCIAWQPARSLGCQECYCTDKCWRVRATFENQPNDLTLDHEHGLVLIW